MSEEFDPAWRQLPRRPERPIEGIWGKEVAPISFAWKLDAAGRKVPIDEPTEEENNDQR